MLIRGMVYHQIHQHLDLTPVRFLKKLFIVFHSSVVLVNPAVIGNVVSIVILRRLQHRGNPQNINAKLFQVIQFFYNSVDISDSVPVAVVKAFGINLIYNAFFPPVFFHTKQFLSVLFFSIHIRRLFHCSGNNAIHDPFLAEDVHDQYRKQYKQIGGKCQIVIYGKLFLEHILCKLQGLLALIT